MARKAAEAALHPRRESENMLRVLMVSDIRLYREGVAQVLGQRETLEAVQMAASSEVALARFDELAPDVVLLDTGVADALALVREIGDRSATARVVAMGLGEAEGEVVAFAEAGIAGYVGLDASAEELVKTIQSALRQELRCSCKIAGALLRRVSALSLESGAAKEDVHLTPRECEIVSLLDRGLTNKEIARDLHIEVTTVKNHVHNILDKLDVHTRGEAVARVRALHRYGSSVFRSGRPRKSSAGAAYLPAAPHPR